MLPAFIHDVYQVGPEGLGILRSSPAIGAIMIGIYLARNPIREHAGKYLLWAVAGFGVCIIGFGLTVSIIMWLVIKRHAKNQAEYDSMHLIGEHNH